MSDGNQLKYPEMGDIVFLHIENNVRGWKKFVGIVGYVNEDKTIDVFVLFPDMPQMIKKVGHVSENTSTLKWSWE